MYLEYDQVNVSGSVLTDEDFDDPPAGTTHVELQASTNHVRYLIDNDGAKNPAENHGMLFLTTQPPKLFLIEDFKNIKFVRDGSSDSVLGVHFIGGRSI